MVFTCHIGKYDPRGFDGILEWLGIHRGLLSAQQLTTLSRREGFSGGDVVTGIANLLIKLRTLFGVNARS